MPPNMQERCDRALTIWLFIIGSADLATRTIHNWIMYSARQVHVQIAPEDKVLRPTPKASASDASDLPEPFLNMFHLSGDLPESLIILLWTMRYIWQITAARLDPGED